MTPAARAVASRMGRWPYVPRQLVEPAETKEIVMELRAGFSPEEEVEEAPPELISRPVGEEVVQGPRSISSSSVAVEEETEAVRMQRPCLT